MLCLQGFYCFIIIGLLRHCSVLGFDCLFLCFLCHYTISSRFPLFHYLFVTSLLCSMLRLHLSLPLFLTSLIYICNVSIVSYLFATSLLCSRLLLSLPLFVAPLYYLFKVSIVLLSAYYVTTMF